MKTIPAFLILLVSLSIQTPLLSRTSGSPEGITQSDSTAPGKIAPPAKPRALLEPPDGRVYHGAQTMTFESSGNDPLAGYLGALNNPAIQPAVRGLFFRIPGTRGPALSLRGLGAFFAAADSMGFIPELSLFLGGTITRKGKSERFLAMARMKSKPVYMSETSAKGMNISPDNADGIAEGKRIRLRRKFLQNDLVGNAGAGGCDARDL